MFLAVIRQELANGSEDVGGFQMTDGLVSLARAARLCGVTSAWLKAESEAGRFPSLHADRRLLFDANTIREALRQRASTIPSTAKVEVTNG